MRSVVLTLSKVSNIFSPLLENNKRRCIARNHTQTHFNVVNKTITQSQILKRTFAFVLFFLLITSFTPNIAFSSEADLQIDYGASALANSTLISDDSGFIIPVNPQTGEADRSEMSDKATHIVQSGETLSTIAESYGLKTTTLMWENNLTENSVLKVGQELVIPPVDGVTHEVKSGQSLDKIAALYDVDKDLIIKQNNLIDEKVIAGQEIFIPGGKQLAPPAPKVLQTTNYRNTVARTESPTRVALESTNATPAAGKFLIYPTRGRITQGYHSYHRAVDIADPSKPPVWAAAAGTVVKASSGTWGGGYGNHVIIDHGNGIQTLYAHLDYITVSVGQYVGQGEVIGRMGNTGRVYGRTGIHLHFEVRENGIKQVPSYYW
jgi:murein DD-endopeptidase MepM/ murein hydrolase activator NlpD